MSNPRVYGTIVHGGLRHEASGVIDGTFAKTKGGWDTYTVCGQYSGIAVETDGDLVISCIKCLGRKRHTDYKDILRGMRYEGAMIDEAQTFTPTQFNELVNQVGEKVVAGASRSYVAESLSIPRGPFPSGRRVTRRY